MNTHYQAVHISGLTSERFPWATLWILTQPDLRGWSVEPVICAPQITLSLSNG
jgi:hypothetical protein